MGLDFTLLGTYIIPGVIYFIVRILGKYIGAYTGSVVSNSHENTRKYLGLALIPQAGVSIGLATLASEQLSDIGLVDQASLIMTIILVSGLLYELFGPPAAKASLYLSESYVAEKSIEVDNTLSSDDI